ncbi:MAG TPA: hypothetical protein GX700_09020 [Paracoccus sp.]|nr:hypothetical protein [Paracoccus sp. (in: a-proteobacteria)]
MQNSLIKAERKINVTPRRNRASSGTTGEAAGAEIFERARVTAAADPELKGIWDRLFDDR